MHDENENRMLKFKHAYSPYRRSMKRNSVRESIFFQRYGLTGRGHVSNQLKLVCFVSLAFPGIFSGSIYCFFPSIKFLGTHQSIVRLLNFKAFCLFRIIQPRRHALPTTPQIVFNTIHQMGTKIFNKFNQLTDVICTHESMCSCAVRVSPIHQTSFSSLQAHVHTTLICASLVRLSNIPVNPRDTRTI